MCLLCLCLPSTSNISKGASPQVSVGQKVEGSSRREEENSRGWNRNEMRCKGQVSARDFSYRIFKRLAECLSASTSQLQQFKRRVCDKPTARDRVRLLLRLHQTSSIPNQGMHVTCQPAKPCLAARLARSPSLIIGAPTSVEVAMHYSWA
jgi:hypothetical protein